MNLSRTRLIFKGTLSQFLIYIIALISLFITFCSFNKNSLGAVCVFLTICLFLLNLKTKDIINLIPFMIASMVTMTILAFSGKISERGFNAPINHVLKFVYLMFTVALSIGMHRLSDNYKLSVLKGIMISIAVSTIISLYNVIFVDRYAIRYYETLGFTKVIDFNQFYGICFTFCIMAFVLLTWHRKYKINKYFVFCIILMIFIGLSLYVTGILLCALGVALGIAVHKYDQSKGKAALWAIVIILALSLIFIFGNQISDWIYKITEPLNFILRDRIRSLADSIFRTDHNLLYSYDRRSELASYSMISFHQNPLWGVGYKGYRYGTIGCHQEWQDMLGVFGLFGISVFIILIGIFSKQVIKNIRNKSDLHTFYIALFLFIVFGFLNPCLSLPVLSAVFIIAPNMSLIFPWWKEL